jgi:hypothetical protein
MIAVPIARGSQIGDSNLHPAGLDTVEQGGEDGAVVQMLRATYAGIAELV